MNSKFQQGSGVNLRSRLKAAGSGSANARYLNGLTSQMKDKILKTWRVTTRSLLTRLNKS
jgi:hypothetical protein